MSTNNRKKALRRVNRIARAVNTAILKDDLWNGRFYMRQKSVSIYPYEDGSGLYGYICYTFIDLATGYSKDYWFELINFSYPFYSKIYRVMNDFIINDCHVWDESPNPYKQQRRQYRKDNSAPKL